MNHPETMGKKQHILFVGQSLKVGGIERAMVEQVNALSREGYDVDLLLFYKGGEYLQQVSPSVRVIGSNLLLTSMAMTKKESKSNVINFLLRTLMYVLSRKVGNRRLYSFLFRYMRVLRDYDIAISYFHDGAEKGLYYGCNLFVLDKVEAHRKVTWVHSDPYLLKAGSDDSRELYKRFDAIVNVSFAMKRKFDSLSVVPQRHSFVVYNRYDEQRILQLADENLAIEQNKATMVTVGRLEYYKGTMELLKIACRLKKQGVVFTWFFLGTGCQLEEAKKFVSDNELKENVIFTGQIANPYPYIKRADLLVSGSLSETFGLSILESLILNTPVVALRYEAIDEVVQNGENGIVADTFEDLYQQLKNLFSEKERLNELKVTATPLLDYTKQNELQIKDIL